MSGVWRADIVGTMINLRMGSLGTKAFELTVESCHEIRALADRSDQELIIGKDLADWYRAETAQPAPPDVSSFELVDLPNLRAEYPKTWEAISSRPFQTVGAAFAARNKIALIADEPGLGKTLQTIAAVVEAKLTGPILVVASPKSAAFLTWPQEIKRWAPHDVVTVIGPHIPASDRGKIVAQIGDNQYGAKNNGVRHWVVCAPNYVRLRADLDQWGNYRRDERGNKVIRPVREAIKEMFDVTWSAIIVDEAHRTLAGATGNKKKQSAQRLGLGALEIAPDGLRIALSGTPARGKEQNIWGILNWLMPDKYRSYWKWVERHFDIFSDGFGTIVGSMKDEEGFYQELKSVMVRRTKREVAPDLPPKQYGGEPLDPSDPNSPVGVWLEMTGAQAKAYKAMQKQATASLEGGELMANGVLAELTRLKQFACSGGKMAMGNDGYDHFVPALPSNKFDWLLDFLEERGITGKEEDIKPSKVIVASQFTKLLNLFRDELNKMGIATHILTGETPDSERIRMMEEFQGEGGPSVFLLNMIAGGASITLDAADDVVLLDVSWNRDDQEQVEDRAHRISRMHNVTIWNLYSRGTVEEGIAKVTSGKYRDIKSLLDGQRGVEFAIKLVNGEVL